MADVIDLFERKFKQEGRSGSIGDEHARRGFQAFQTGDHYTAAQEMMQAIHYGSQLYSEAEIYAVLGMSFNERGMYRQAIETLKHAVGLEPSYYHVWNHLGLACSALGKLDQAEEFLWYALKVKPDYSYAISSLGVIKMERNRPEEAIRLLKKAIRLNNGLAIAHGNLALAYAVAGRFEEAHNQLQQATARGYAGWREIKRRIDDLEEFARSDSSPAGASSRQT